MAENHASCREVLVRELYWAGFRYELELLGVADVAVDVGAKGSSVHMFQV